MANIHYSLCTMFYKNQERFWILIRLEFICDSHCDINILMDICIVAVCKCRKVYTYEQSRHNTLLLYYIELITTV